MAGRAFRDMVDARVVQKRDATNCTPDFTNNVIVGPCVGDCREAVSWQTATNCLCNNTFTSCPVAYSQSVDCSVQLPCQCFFNDLLAEIGTGVATCGDCATLSEGETCYFVCTDPTYEFFGPQKATCLGTGWAALPQEPVCLPKPVYCPTIYSTGGLNLDMSTDSVCVEASEKDVCRGSCFPGYYSPTGTYTTTCSCVNGVCNWSNDLFCQCQGNCKTAADGFCSQPLNLNTT